MTYDPDLRHYRMCYFIIGAALVLLTAYHLWCQDIIVATSNLMWIACIVNLLNSLQGSQQTRDMSREIHEQVSRILARRQDFE